MGEPEFEKFDAEMRARAVPSLVHEMSCFFHARQGMSKPSLMLLFTGDPTYNGPVDLTWELNGQWVSARVTAKELDTIRYSDLGNVVIVDEPLTFHGLVRQAKLGVDGRRGYMTPSIHYMTRADFDDITNWSREDEEDPTHKDSEG